MTQGSEKLLAKLRWFESRVEKRCMSSRTSLVFASILGSTKGLPPTGGCSSLPLRLTRVWLGDALDRALNYRKTLDKPLSRCNDAGASDQAAAGRDKITCLLKDLENQAHRRRDHEIHEEVGIPERRV